MIVGPLFFSESCLMSFQSTVNLFNYVTAEQDEKTSDAFTSGGMFLFHLECPVMFLSIKKYLYMHF